MAAARSSPSRRPSSKASSASRSATSATSKTRSLGRAPSLRLPRSLACRRPPSGRAHTGDAPRLSPPYLQLRRDCGLGRRPGATRASCLEARRGAVSDDRRSPGRCRRRSAADAATGRPHRRPACWSRSPTTASRSSSSSSRRMPSPISASTACSGSPPTATSCCGCSRVFRPFIGFLRDNAVYLGYPALCTISVLWSDVPRATAVFAIQLLASVLIALFIAMRLPIEAIFRQLLRVYLVAMAASLATLAGAFVHPWDHRGNFTGIFLSKNAFGHRAVLFAYRLRRGRAAPARAGPARRGRLPACARGYRRHGRGVGVGDGDSADRQLRARRGGSPPVLRPPPRRGRARRRSGRPRIRPGVADGRRAPDRSGRRALRPPRPRSRR